MYVCNDTLDSRLRLVGVSDRGHAVNWFFWIVMVLMPLMIWTVVKYG